MKRQQIILNNGRTALDVKHSIRGACATVK